MRSLITCYHVPKYCVMQPCITYFLGLHLIFKFLNFCIYCFMSKFYVQYLQHFLVSKYHICNFLLQIVRFIVIKCNLHHSPVVLINISFFQIKGWYWSTYEMYFKIMYVILKNLIIIKYIYIYVL